MKFKPSHFSKSVCLLMACAVAILGGCSQGSGNKDKSDGSGTASSQAASNCSPGFDIDMPGVPEVTLDELREHRVELELADAFVFTNYDEIGPEGSSTSQVLIQMTPEVSKGILDPSVSMTTICAAKSGEPTDTILPNFVPLHISIQNNVEQVQSYIFYSSETPNTLANAGISYTDSQYSKRHFPFYLSFLTQGDRNLSRYKIYKTAEDTYEIRTIAKTADSSGSNADMLRMIYKTNINRFADTEEDRNFMTTARINELQPLLERSHDTNSQRHILGRISRLPRALETYDRFVTALHFELNNHVNNFDGEAFAEHVALHSTDQQLNRYIELYLQYIQSGRSTLEALRSAVQEAGIHFEFNDRSSEQSEEASSL